MGCSLRLSYTLWTLGPFSEGTGFGYCHKCTKCLIQSDFVLRYVLLEREQDNTMELPLFVCANHRIIEYFCFIGHLCQVSTHL